MTHALRKRVFFPPFLLLLMATTVSIVSPSIFLGPLTSLHYFLLHKLGALFSGLGFMMVLISLLVMVSPIRRLRIGGDDAIPYFSTWHWVVISVCATEACGMLFWGVTEPLIHFQTPGQGVVPGNAAFAMSAIFLHWTLTPYAIYCLPALLFALVYHHYRYPFSLASCFYPLLSPKVGRQFSGLIDSICLYALVMGMAASFATGVLVLMGGLHYIFAIEKSPLSIGLMTGLVVVTFVTMASLGIKRGLKNFAVLKVFLVLILVVYVVIYASMPAVFYLGLNGLKYYGQHFFNLELWPILNPKDEWGYQWSVFLWAVWMSWAPVSALFLGNIAKGRTVGAFMVVNLILPCLVNLIWMWLFGGFSLSFHDTGFLLNALDKTGPESIIYYLLGQYPWSFGIIILFFITVFISFVISADANTQIMASVSVKQTDPDKLYSPVILQVLWGSILGAVVYLTLLFSGLDGIKMLANFSGLPVLIILFLMMLSLLVLIVKHRR